jgi:hypothetical protein
VYGPNEKKKKKKKKKKLFFRKEQPEQKADFLFLGAFYYLGFVFAPIFVYL